MAMSQNFVAASPEKLMVADIFQEEGDTMTAAA